jgi:hypothetical protein
VEIGVEYHASAALSSEKEDRVATGMEPGWPHRDPGRGGREKICTPSGN